MDFRPSDPSVLSKSLAYIFQCTSAVIFMFLSIGIFQFLLDYKDSFTCFDLEAVLVSFLLTEFFDALVDVPKQVIQYAIYTTYGSKDPDERDILLDNLDRDNNFIIDD